MPLLPPQYKIVEIRPHAVFAGKLGKRVSEEIVVARGDVRILVRIAGTYHTLAVRPASRLHVGDTVTIRGDLKGPKATVARDRIRKA